MLTIAGCLKDSNSLLFRGCYSGRARHHSGLFCTVWWVFKVNPRQWIPLLGFVPGPEHPLFLSAWVLGGFRYFGQLWVCWWFLLFLAQCFIQKIWQVRLFEKLDKKNWKTWQKLWKTWQQIWKTWQKLWKTWQKLLKTWQKLWKTWIFFWKTWQFRLEKWVSADFLYLKVPV